MRFKISRTIGLATAFTAIIKTKNLKISRSATAETAVRILTVVTAVLRLDVFNFFRLLIGCLSAVTAVFTLNTSGFFKIRKAV